jgi:hypothetical protein
VNIKNTHIEKFDLEEFLKGLKIKEKYLKQFHKRNLKNY